MQTLFFSIFLFLASPLLINGFLPGLSHASQQSAPITNNTNAIENEEQDPATPELISNVKTIKAGEPFWVALKITLHPGWHVYWKNPGDSGLATKIDWTLPEGFTASPIHWLPPQRFEKDNLVTFGYAHEAYHLVKITPPKNLSPQNNTDQPITLKASVSWLACLDSCIPGFADLTLNLSVSPEQSIPSDHKDLMNELIQELPIKSSTHGAYKIDRDILHVYLPKGLGMDHDIGSLVIMPDEQDLITYTASNWFKKDGYYHLDLTKNSLNKSQSDFKALVQMNDLKEKKIISTEVLFEYKDDAVIDSTYPEESDSFLLILCFSFLGGLILNAMPCVFPILSLKIFAIAKKSQQQKRRVFLNGIFYTIGVTLSFLGMAMLLLLIKQAGQTVGWGFQMQNPYFIFLMIDLLFFLALSLSGRIELPILFGNTHVNSSSKQENLMSNLWIGILAVLVATPCTGPFMGAAMGYAFTQEASTVLIVFFVLSIGFSMPFLLLALFPAVLQKFPKPGPWMETLKEFMAFPLYLTVAWLLWVLVQQTGDRGLFASLVSIILIRFAVWIFQKKNFKTSLFKFISIFLVAFIALSPITYVEKENFCDVQKPLAFNKSVLMDLHSQRRPIFMYATAAWCLTCKLNELAITSKATEDLFRQHDVTLMEADWTNGNHEITEYLAEFGRSGVPLYVYYPPEGKPIILPQILTEGAIKDVVTQRGR